MWQAFLDRFLVEGGTDAARVRYGAVSRADRDSLEAYLRRMQGCRPSRLPAPEQKAYWLNLYNAGTVSLVLRHFPVASIRDIRLAEDTAGRGPWSVPVLTVEGRPLSLDNVEHDILRKSWRSPLLHFGLNCASLGCPDLPAAAFTAGNTDSLLEAGARKYINSPRGAAFSGDTLILSSLFDWYRQDFGSVKVAPIAFVASFAAPALRASLEGFSGPIRYRYDWRLNAADPPRRGRGAAD